ncbi:MAG: carbohydrate-binding protein, partial [Syntrophorhabdales bacterium]
MMRKQIINRNSKEPASGDHAWLDLERLAKVEITSEETGHPIESALTTGGGPGWLANETGKQTIRLLFDEPQAVRHIHLVFEEGRRERTHEFVLRWSKD